MNVRLATRILDPTNDRRRSRNSAVLKDRAKLNPDPEIDFGRSICLGGHYLARRRVRLDDGLIRKSSSFFPDLSCRVSQWGCFPRPAQVSDGWVGFLYFGKTRG